MNRGVAALGCSLLAEADESCANEHLEFRLALHGKLVSGASNGVHQRAAIAAAIELGEIGDANCGRPSGFGRVHGDAGDVIQKHFVDGF